MTNLFEHKAARYTLIACIIIIAILACVDGVKITEERNVDDTYAIARRLGYTDVEKIAFYKTCWDVGSSCGMFLHFTTNKSFDEFKKEVDGMGFHAVFLNSIDGSFLFTEFYYDAKMNLTVDGNSTRGLSTLHIKNPSAKNWSITDQNGRRISVEFFEVAKETAIYEINGKRVTGNIVTIILQTR